MLWRLIKALLVLVILGAIGVVIYAYVGPVIFPADFTPPTQSVTEPITLTVD